MQSNSKELTHEEMMNLSQREQNKLIMKYEPLVVKITRQFVQKTGQPWEVIKSMAYEGLILAFKNYDASKSELTFLQYAGYSIRNCILYSLDNELRTVKMNQYNQAQAVASGDPLFNMVNFDQLIKDSDDGRDSNRSVEIRLGFYENEKFSCGDIYEYLYYRIEQNFKQRDCEMFYKVFGLNGFADEKSQDVAKFYNVSNGLISQKIKKIVEFIKHDNDLCEMLGQLLEK